MKLWECPKCDNWIITDDNCKEVYCTNHMATKEMKLVKTGTFIELNEWLGEELVEND